MTSQMHQNLPESLHAEERDARPTPSGGIYDLPVVGQAARGVRGFYDDMEPTQEDSLGVTVGKEMIRYGTVAAAGVAGVATALIVAF